LKDIESEVKQMNLPPFDDFFNTITEDKFLSWLENDNKSLVNVSKNEKGDMIINVTELATLLLSVNNNMLRSYHEWLSEQLKNL
jgi:hypothetical protein